MHSEECVEWAGDAGPSKDKRQEAKEKTKQNKTAFSLMGSLRFPCFNTICFNIIGYIAPIPEEPREEKQLPKAWMSGER